MDLSKIDTQIGGLKDLIDGAVADADREGYARGFQDALNHITSAAAAAAAITPKVEDKPSPPNAGQHTRVELSPEPRPGTDQARVLNDIRAHPGTRGIDVVNRLNGQVQERTIRTSLFRLKTRGAIVRNENGWSAALLEKDEGRLSLG